MPLSQRVLWTFTSLAFLVMTSGCATSNLRLVEEELARSGTGIRMDKGQEIDGYLLYDGTMADYKGRVRLAGQDSLSFWGEEYVGERSGSSDREKITVPGPTYSLATVKALDVRDPNTASTVLLATFGFLVVLPVVVWGLSGFEY